MPKKLLTKLQKEILMLPTKKVFDLDNLDSFKERERVYYEAWVGKAIDFIKGKIDATEIKYMTRIVEDMIKVAYKRSSNAHLIWRMKNSNEKDLH